MRTVRLLPVPFVLSLGLIGMSQAHADEPNARSYLFGEKSETNGVLTVTEIIRLDASSVELTQRIVNRVPLDRNRYYVHDTSRASVMGAENFISKVEGDYTVFSMKSSAEVKITYKVTGTTRSKLGSNGEVSVSTWRALQGLSVGVERVSGSLQVDAMAQLVDCTVGPPGTPEKCQLHTADAYNSLTLKFESATWGADERVTFIVGFSVDQAIATVRIHEQWNLNRAFMTNSATTGAALAILVVGALLPWWLHRRAGVDFTPSGKVSTVGSFRLVGGGESVFELGGGMRLGLVGTVAGECVDPIDTTATLIDLAARGHLRITKLQHTQYGSVDWQFSCLENPVDELLPHKSRLLNAVVPDGGHSLASQLPEVLAPALGQVQDALYDEVVERGWFKTCPDSTRSSWAVRGWTGFGAALATGAALIAFTRFGLVALVLLALAISLLWMAPRTSRRTPDGTRLAAALGALSALLNTHPANQTPRGRELAEISRLLPYTIVLGGRQRWLETVAAAGADDTPDPTEASWYHAPETWHLRGLPAPLMQFVNTA